MATFRNIRITICQVCKKRTTCLSYNRYRETQEIEIDDIVTRERSNAVTDFDDIDIDELLKHARDKRNDIFVKASYKPKEK